MTRGRKKEPRRKKRKIFGENIWPVEEKMSREGKGRKYGERKVLVTLTTKTNNRQTIPDICHFFTRAKFLENKIYTKKTRKL